jgi:hypothetical protein
LSDGLLDRPGVKTLWIGMQRMADFAAGLEFAKQILAI